MTISALSESLLFDAASLLARAGALGLPLAEVSAAIWPSGGKGQHAAAGRVLGELRRRGFVMNSPGSSGRKRYALTPDGNSYVRNFTVQSASDGADLIADYREARFAAPPQPRTLPAHVTLIIDWAMRPLPECAGMRDADRDARYRAMYDATIAALHQACAGDHAMFTAAGEEWGRRVRADIARIRTSLYGSPTAGPPAGAPVWG